MILCLFALVLTISQYKEKPNFAPISAEVNIAPSPIAPTILRFANPTGIGIAGPYNPVQAGLSPTYMSVLVEDLNGNQQLPSSPNYPIVLNAQTGPSNILAGTAAPTNSPDPFLTRSASECLPIDCTSPEVVNTGLSCTTGRELFQLIYLCKMLLWSSDPAGNWRFSMSITDSTGLSSSTPAPLSGNPGFPEFVVYNTLSAFYFGIYPNTPQSFVWNTLTLAGTNQITANGLTITNIGNTPSNPISITGTDLLGINTPTSVLNKNAFTLSTLTGGVPPTECISGPNTITLSGISQTIPGAIVPYTQATSVSSGPPGFDMEVIYACIPNTLLSSITGVPDIQYKTPIGQDWTLTL